MSTVDWTRIPGPERYRPERAAAAERALADAATEYRAGRAVADLRHEVSNDHAGSLYPAAVPATSVFVQVILERPGEPRYWALTTLLDWWGLFRPEPGFPGYPDPEAGPVEITEGIVLRVREKAPELARLAGDPRTDRRKDIAELLRCVHRGWVVEDC
ncbi:hypothetical protein [Amycolatopsis samaneae]|uniref:Immunity protein Imm1 n=1 Tax=Amycolatopsis samaneae TaxID=664691 RepID=A0ABW5GBP6_9PSEU